MKSELLPLFIGVPELLPWFPRIPSSFSSERPHQRWGHLSCWTRKQLPLAAFPAGLTDLKHHSAEPEHGSVATASPLSQAAIQCQAPRSPSCCESMRETHLVHSGTHSSAARPTQYGCWGDQERWVRWNYDGSSCNWQAQKAFKAKDKVLSNFKLLWLQRVTSLPGSSLLWGGNILYKFPVPGHTHHSRPWGGLAVKAESTEVPGPSLPTQCSTCSRDWD